MLSREETELNKTERDILARIIAVEGVYGEIWNQVMDLENGEDR